MLTSGATLQEVGDVLGVTREAVRAMVLRKATPEQVVAITAARAAKMAQRMGRQVKAIADKRAAAIAALPPCPVCGVRITELRPGSGTRMCSPGCSAEARAESNRRRTRERYAKASPQKRRQIRLSMALSILRSKTATAVSLRHARKVVRLKGGYIDSAKSRSLRKYEP
jgi:hypothetical protein